MGKNSQYKRVLFIISCISIVPFLIISFYSRPAMDDFSNSLALHRVMVKGGSILDLINCAWKENMRYYHVWNGLYSSQFLVQFQTGIFGEKVYFVGVLLLLLFGEVTIFALIKEIGDYFKLDLKPLFISILVYAYVLQGLPSTVEGIYWIAGACPYMGFLYLTFLNVALVIRYFRNEGFGCLVLLMITSFVISGGSQVPSFLNILLLLTFSLIGWFHKRNKLILPFLSASLGFAIMCLAPGTTARQSTLSRQGVLTTVVHSIFGTYQYACWWINISWFASAIILLCCAFRLYSKFPILSVKPVYIWGYSVGILCALLCVPYYPMGTFGPERLQNVIWVVFMMLSWLSLWYTYVYYLQRHKNLSDIDLKSLHIIVVVMLLVCLFNRDANCLSVSKELLNGTAKLYATQNDDRYERMTEQMNETIIVFKPLIDSKHLKVDDLSTDSSEWQNDAWKNYFGVLPVLSD